MPLQSRLFQGDPALEACLVSDPAHVTQGAAGNHVAKIQTALATLDGLQIDPGELSAKRYGASTAAAVLAFKKKRNIINRSYQTQADNIVGKMTIAALDKEMLMHESIPPQPTPPQQVMFRALGEPRTLNPIRPTFVGNAVSIKAGLRQFEWLARVTATQPVSSCFHVGFLQTLMANEITADYSAPGRDPHPRQARVVVTPLPIRDHLRAGQVGPFDWAASTAIGRCTIADLKLPAPPGTPPTLNQQWALLSFGDDPGGRLPLNDPQFPEKLLRRVSIQHRFITWIAARRPLAPVNQVGSYQFLRYCVWTVNRSFTVVYRDSGPVGTFIDNLTRVVEVRDGMGSHRPVLVPPDANESARLVFV
ncbi:MAG: hypothetical protein ABSG91_03360 [Syntrophobacteraceae bacterium]